MVHQQLLQYEAEYGKLVSDKQQVLETEMLDPVVYDEILIELQELDGMYDDLKNEISNVPDAEALLETAIRFHERRLRILELLEREIEHQKRIQRHEEEIRL